jgi:hypothetical protein
VAKRKPAQTKRTPKKDAAPVVVDEVSARMADGKAKFIAMFAVSANVRLSCIAAGVARTTAYGWRKDDEAFKDAWREARAQACDILEAKAWERATRQIDPSDTLLIFLLKAHRKRKFRENYNHEHTGARGGPIQIAADFAASVDKIYGNED